MTRRIAAIAAVTVREAARRKLLAALGLITVAMVGLSAWGFDRLSHNSSLTSGETNLALPQSLILFMFMFSFVFALSASAIASPSVAADVESGILMTVATRPIRRSEIIIGKWLGLAFLLAGYAAAVSALEFGVVDWVSGYLPPDAVLAAVYLFLEGLLLLSLAVCLSTRLSSLATGVVGIALFGAAWLAGVVGSLGSAFDLRALRTIGKVSRIVLPTDGLWHGAIYYLEPSYLIHAHFFRGRNEDPFFSQAAPTGLYLTWVALWVLVILAVSVVSFQQREL